jgi:hypothetical protein
MRFVCLLLSFAVSLPSYASCDWSKDVSKNADGSYTYSKQCHLEVGSSLEELDLRRRQVGELNRTVELKDLAIKYSEERTQLWMDSTLKMNDRLNQYEASRSREPWLYFGIGVAATVLSVWAAGQISK